MVNRGSGAIYSVSPAPQMGGVPELRAWCQREFDRIREALDEGRAHFIRLDVLTEVPAKPIDGMMCYFAADAISAGSPMGVFERKAGAWIKL